MKVARHGMPGMCHPEPRPVGYGMIGGEKGLLTWMVEKRGATDHTVPYGTDHVCLCQAFHAWLPSFRPSGTKVSFLRLTLLGGCRTILNRNFRLRRSSFACRSCS
jgi:hypothetical protein